ncbi:site-specific integrase [Chromohalobacter japonicus]|uniref:site-specific integrase n=1 Tax=Chromohalobacter japonicus TaxID=223900 RepID=UPI001FF3F861|nr:site-specific integrase [Chromohalobacter japonicus]MCK0751295.1 site-specific integrase [Chromohalobacter japonicus]
MEQVDATAHPRLYRRGARYYHRAAIPQDIRATYPKTEETFSLGTSDYQEALRQVRKAAHEVDQRFEQHRQQLAAQANPLSGLTEQQLQWLSDLFYAYLLEADEEYRREFDWDSDADFDAAYEAFTDEIESAQTAYITGRIAKRFHRFAEESVEVNLDSPLSPESSDWNALAWRLQQTFIIAAQAILARQRGEVALTPTQQSIQPQNASQAYEKPGSSSFEARQQVGQRLSNSAHSASAETTPLLSTAVDEWLSEKVRDWSTKTYKDHDKTLENFRTVAGDKPLSQYGKADGRLFKGVLLKLPPNWTKQKPLQGLTIDTAADKAAKLGMEPMSGKNLNKIIGYAASFWSWASAHYDDCPSNPLAGLKVKLKASAREERSPFQVSDLKAIFHAPVFTGCKSLHHWRQPGTLIPRNSGMFWTPLISLFSGMRMGEVLQLYVSDIREDQGIHYIDINDAGQDKSLKTSSSSRTVPVHDELIRLGFLDHVQLMHQQGSQRLFPDMEMGNDGYYSSVYSKRFRALLDHLKIKHGKNSFHSFRHNFEDACRNSGISKEVMDALQGHTEAGMSGRYGSGYALGTLSDAIHRLEYRGLDLSHLHRNT